MKSFRFSSFIERWGHVGLIILVTLLTYAPLINRLGFYRDDWYLLWTYMSEGADGLVNLFVGDRPFVGWLYVLDFNILGSHPLGWHVYALLLKIISGLAFFWLLNEVWRNRRFENLFITLLFVVYPGFFQQPNALTFKQLLLAYAVSLLSLACGFRAIRSTGARQKILFVTLAVFLSVFYMFIYEALIGMEAARLLLLWFYFYRQNLEWRKSLTTAVKWFFPYLLLSALFVIWRVFIFQSTRRATSVEVLSQSYASLHGLTRLAAETFKDVLESTFLAWGVPFYQFTVSARYRDLGLAIGIATLVAVVSARYYQKREEAKREDSSESALDWVGLGLGIVVVTTLPVVAAGRNALFAVQWDRYTYQASIGVAMVMGGLVFYGLRGHLRIWVLTALMISGVVTQVGSAMFYRDFWAMERAAWWQLYWRAPQIADGTTVIASLPEAYQLAEEYEAWGPLNLIYHRDGPLQISAQIPYQELLVDLERGLQEERLVRGTVLVKRNYAQSMVISIPSSDSCLHVYQDALGMPFAENPLVVLAAPFSRTDWIQTSATPPAQPVEIFGDEPAHNWCFYYQKINLALQAGKWSEAARLSDEAIAGDFRPKDSAEWLSVLFAYSNSDQPRKLKQASKFINDKNTRWYLCSQLKSVPKLPGEYKLGPVLENLCTTQ